MSILPNTKQKQSHLKASGMRKERQQILDLTLLHHRENLNSNKQHCTSKLTKLLLSIIELKSRSQTVEIYSFHGVSMVCIIHDDYC